MKQPNLLTAQSGFNRCVLGREGYVVYNHNDRFVGQAIEHYGEYAELEAQLLRQICPPGAVVVELGANIGTHTQALSRCVGPTGVVYAYEPQRIVFQTLCANLAVNSIVNVDARNAALGAENGFVRIPDIDYAAPGNFGGVQVSRYAEGRKVRKVRLDDDLELGRLDVIKIDVEGMELEALQGSEGLIQRFHPLLYVENDRFRKSEALVRHLMGRGYRLYWHLPRLFNPKNFFAHSEDLYKNTVSLNMLCVPSGRSQEIAALEEITDPRFHPLRPSKPGAA